MLLGDASGSWWHDRRDLLDEDERAEAGEEEQEEEGKFGNRFSALPLEREREREEWGLSVAREVPERHNEIPRYVFD